MRRIIFILILWIGAFQCAPAEPTSLAVAADSSLRGPLKELAQAWADQRNQMQINLELTSNGALHEGLVSGQAWDLVILASPAEVKSLTASGHLLSAGQKALARNELIAFGHKALVTDEELDWYDLIDQEWNRVAMGDPDKVFSGYCAAAAMQKRGVDKKLKLAPLLGGDARAALASAQRNEADAVFLFRTDLPESAIPGFDVFKIDDADYPQIIYTAALPKNGRQPALAADFIVFLHGKTARETLKKWNFVVDQ